MNELKFMIELEKGMASLPRKERDELLADYRAHFEEGRARGKSEEEIATSLGEPKALGRSFLADYHVEKIRNPTENQPASTTMYHVLRASIVILSLLAFNFFFLFGPLTFVSAALFFGWVTSIVMVVVGLAVSTVGVFINLLAGITLLAFPANLSLMFYSLGFTSAALLFCVGLYWLTKVFILGLYKYAKGNIRLVNPNFGAVA